MCVIFPQNACVYALARIKKILRSYIYNLRVSYSENNILLSSDGIRYGNTIMSGWNTDDCICTRVLPPIFPKRNSSWSSLALLLVAFLYLSSSLHKRSLSPLSTESTFSIARCSCCFKGREHIWMAINRRGYANN